MDSVSQVFLSAKPVIPTMGDQERFLFLFDDEGRLHSVDQTDDQLANQQAEIRAQFNMTFNLQHLIEHYVRQMQIQPEAIDGLVTTISAIIAETADSVISSSVLTPAQIECLEAEHQNSGPDIQLADCMTVWLLNNYVLE